MGTYHAINLWIVLLPIAGNFGITQFPFVFDVISRSLDRRLNLELEGGVEDYVDDIQGCCLDEAIPRVIKGATRIITDLLGDDAVAEDKTEHGRVIEWIGWKFDLNTMTVSIADHNYYKTLYEYFGVVKNGKYPIRYLHSLASWAARYALVCPFMSPFSGYLFSAFSGYNNLEVIIQLPNTAYLVVYLWRIFFFMMKLDPQNFSRPLESFRPFPQAQFLLEIDGCPEGIGVLIYLRVGPKGHEEDELIYGFSWCGEYSLNNDSKYQNSMEFIAAVMGIACLGYLRFNDVHIEVLGDNTSSLSWLSALKFKPGPSTSAAIAYMLLNKIGKMNVVNTVFRPGVKNVLADALSRGTHPSRLGLTEENSFTRDTAPPILKELSRLLDPSVNIMDESKLLDHWTQYTNIIERIFDVPIDR